MNDFIAGPASGSSEGGTGPWGGGTPPPVLLAAMGAAVLIAVTLVAFLVGNGGGGGDSRPLPVGSVGRDDPGAAGSAPIAEKRALLSVSVEGGGSGKVRIAPLDVSCGETCEHEFTTGTRVTVTADPAAGSRFEGWNDACSGVDSCSFFMDRQRTLTATFEGSPSVSQCQDGRDNDGDGFTDEADPGCGNDDTEAPDNRVRPVGDCADGRDNDSDGLIDSAQDPGCASGGTEAGGGSVTSPPPLPTTTAPPPPPPTTTPGPAGAPPVSECRDGRDNDGDGLTDRPADPGCDADGTEAGG